MKEKKMLQEGEKKVEVRRSLNFLMHQTEKNRKGVTDINKGSNESGVPFQDLSLAGQLLL